MYHPWVQDLDQGVLLLEIEWSLTVLQKEIISTGEDLLSVTFLIVLDESGILFIQHLLHIGSMITQSYFFNH